jgi:hypothetical protein
MQISVIPVDLTHHCAFWYGAEKRCVLTVNRLYSTWHKPSLTWRPQLKLCHLHAQEAMTGKPVMAETFEERERVMRLLGA